MDGKEQSKEQSRELLKDEILQRKLDHPKPLLGNKYASKHIQPSEVIGTFVSKIVDVNSS